MKDAVSCRVRFNQDEIKLMGKMMDRLHPSILIGIRERRAYYSIHTKLIKFIKEANE